MVRSLTWAATSYLGARRTTQHRPAPPLTALPLSISLLVSRVDPTTQSKHFTKTCCKRFHSTTFDLVRRSQEGRLERRASPPHECVNQRSDAILTLSFFSSPPIFFFAPNIFLRPQYVSSKLVTFLVRARGSPRSWPTCRDRRLVARVLSPRVTTWVEKTAAADGRMWSPPSKKNCGATTQRRRSRWRE